MKSAIISECGQYRYTLMRGNGDAGGARLCFIMLNPSTADADEDDPTIRRCLGYMEAWGFSELLVLNLYAYRATDPRDLFSVKDRHGPENDEYIRTLLPICDFVVCAWGNNALVPDQQRFIQLAKQLEIPLHYLELTKMGRPAHPLYLKSDLSPSLWEI